jgi:hypothetical protein
VHCHCNSSRRDISGEIAARIDAAVRAGHLPAQDTAPAATALLGALHEALMGPLAPDNMDDPGRLRDAVQTVTLLALRAVGVMDVRARGLVVQAVLPAKALVGASTSPAIDIALTQPSARLGVIRSVRRRSIP